MHRDAKETELAKRLIAFKRQWEEGIIDPEVKCFVVQSKRAPTAHMIRSVAASVSPIARPSAPRIPPFFTADNDVLTQDWGPAYAKCPDFGGLFDVITSAPDPREGNDNRWPKELTVHGDKSCKAGCLLVPKDMSERLVSQLHKTPTLQAGGTKPRHSLQAGLIIPQLKDICKKVCAHYTVCQAQNPANYKAPGDSQFYAVPEHRFESLCIDVFSTRALTVKEAGAKGSTSTPFDAVLMCVDRHSGYIVAASTTKEGLTGQ